MIIGLTGGVAMGKSESAKYFKMFGAYIIDVDKISYDVVDRGMPALNELINNLGSDILYFDGTLNRKKLADIIFSDKKIKLIVEKILHPYIILKTYEMMKQKINQYDNIVIDAPLLFEVGLDKMCYKTVVIWIPYDVQIKRFAYRDKLNVEQIKRRICSQMSIEKKIELADFTIDNIGSKRDLKKKIKNLYVLLTSMK
ncbi:MAG: dephospho-CoA kinase [Endomicrobium sp.]|jgi:dephospho-CoA kinase|nr:dephospho-CoA kinase [Endomicrobium sp.]